MEEKQIEKIITENKYKFQVLGELERADESNTSTQRKRENSQSAIKQHYSQGGNTKTGGFCSE